MDEPGGGAKPPAAKRKRRFRWPLRIGVALVLLELLARQFVARPNRILRHSDDAEMIYESSPGAWLGHAKYNIWVAPIYMVLDIVNAGADVKPPPPMGYTIYRIDDDGCRAPSEGPPVTHADVVVLGSSQTFGLFVPEEETLPALLEKALVERGHKGVRTGNCGVIGHHLVQTLRTAERLRPHKQPKLNVVLVRPWHLREQVDYTRIVSPENVALRWLVHQSSLARIVFYVAHRDPNQFNKPLVPADVLEARVDRYLGEMRQSGVRTVFFLLDDKSDECALYDQLTPMLQKKGLPVQRVDMPMPGHNEYFVDHDEHWSRKGAELVTSEILDVVDRELTAAEAH